MPSRRLDFPIFDADNHMYEPPEAMTKHLPPEYEGVIQYVQVKGRTKIAVKGQISDYIPNPTFEVVAAPGAQEEYFKTGNPEGKTRKEDGDWRIEKRVLSHGRRLCAWAWGCPCGGSAWRVGRRGWRCSRGVVARRGCRRFR